MLYFTCNSMVWYGLLGGFAFYLAKRVHDLIESNLSSFEVSCRLFFIKTFTSIQLDPEVEHMKELGCVFLDLDRSSKGCEMEFAILITIKSITHKIFLILKIIINSLGERKIFKNISLKTLWQWLTVNFSFAFYIFKKSNIFKKQKQLQI